MWVFFSAKGEIDDEEEYQNLHDEIDRNGTGFRITFQFIVGKSQDFVSHNFGSLDITKKFYCPYIFIDPPNQYSVDWAEGDWQLALSQAKIRSSATSGMVVAIVHPTQLRAAYDAMLAVVSPEYVPHVMTVNLKHGEKRTDFPRHALLVLVHFWGDIAPAAFNVGEASSTFSGVSHGGLPNDLTIDTSFLKHGLTDVIHLPKVNFWRKKEVIVTGGGLPLPTPVASTSGSAQPAVDNMQRPLELYLYFLIGFKFPACINPGHCYVFDLCCGSGSASLAASMCSHHSIGIDSDAEKIAQCQIRLKEDAGHWTRAIKGLERAPDFFMARTQKMSAQNQPNETILKKHPWMQVETLQNRIQQSMRGEETEHEGGGDDGDGEMQEPTGTAESID